MKSSIKIGCFGSSILSAYWNGAATYYRGIFKEMARLGHTITFFEPDAYERQSHRDVESVEGVRSVVFNPEDESLRKIVSVLGDFDVLVKCSGIGVLDDYLEVLFPLISPKEQLLVFWDVDAPATLAHLRANPDCGTRQFVKNCDLILTYGGGDRVIDSYQQVGAAACIPVYNAADPETHFPVREYHATRQYHLLFMGNRLPDREQRVTDFFFEAAQLLPRHQFALAGSGWESFDLPSNVTRLGHAYTHQHNELNGSALAVLNISRNDMAQTGYSPATRVFEAAAAGACVITDEWEGIPHFFEPDEEILVAGSGLEVAMLLSDLSLNQAVKIGNAARQRVIREHTYRHRALQVEQIFRHHLIYS